MKTRRSITFTKNAEDFTSNNFLKCAQVKKLKCVTLLFYERGKGRLRYKLDHFLGKSLTSPVIR